MIQVGSDQPLESEVPEFGVPGPRTVEMRKARLRHLVGMGIVVALGVAAAIILAFYLQRSWELGRPRGK